MTRPKRPKPQKSAQHLRADQYPAWLFVPTKEPPADYQQRLQSGAWCRASTAVLNQGVMMRYVTAKKIREILKDVPDNVILVVPGDDHSMRPAVLNVGTVLYDVESESWTEDRGEESTSEADFGKRLPAIIME